MWVVAQGIVRIENLAGDAAPGTLMFPNSCSTASEICAPDAAKTASEATAVHATSVDAWRSSHDVGRIFWLAIDTEGNDPAVLRGAEKTLADGEAVVLQVRSRRGEGKRWRRASAASYTSMRGAETQRLNILGSCAIG